MSIQNDYTLNPVTALSFYQSLHGLSLLFAGEGSHLKIYDTETSTIVTTCRVFTSQIVHGITVSGRHGSADDLQVIIWGGRSFVLLSATEIHSIIRKDVVSLASLETLASDWLMGCAISPFNSVESVFVTAHNLALRLCLRNQPMLSALVSPSQSVLYSADVIWKSPTYILAAAGTVFGEIEVIAWYLGNSVDIRSQVLFTLTGHEGSIFGIQISEEITGPDGNPRRLLASCSDDRTIRVWDIGTDSCLSDFGSNDTKISLRETGFGDNGSESRDERSVNRCIASVMAHVSRIWRVYFLPSANERNINVLSFGEDTTVQQWSLENWIYAPSISFLVSKLSSAVSATSTRMPVLIPVKTFAFHSGKHIWSADLKIGRDGQNWMATGGADGKVSVYPIYSTDFKVRDGSNLHLLRSSNGSDEIQSLTLGDIILKLPMHEELGSEGNLPLLPNPSSMAADDTLPSVTKKKAKLPQSPVDYLNRYAFVTTDQILVTTSSGRVLLGSISLRNWKELRLPETSNQDLKSNAMVIGIPYHKSVMIAAANGTVYWYTQGQQIIEMAKLGGKVAGFFNVSETNQSNLSILVTTLSGGVATQLSISVVEGIATLNRLTNISLTTGFVVTSAGFVGRTLILGSRDGSLAVYDNLEPGATAYQQRVGIDAVTSIITIPGISNTPYFLATSRDGTYSVFSLQICVGIGNSGTGIIDLVHRASPPFGPMIEGAWFEDRSLILYGFRSKNFIIWNESEHYEITSAECGGGHRSYAYIPVAGAKGAGHFVYTKASKMYIHSQTAPSHQVIKPGGQGREIKACAIHRDQTTFATGAEDTSIRIWKYISSDAGTGFECAAIIEKHTAGIQCLQWADVPEEPMYLFSAGGYEEFHVWSISRIPNFGLGVVCEATLTDLSPEHDLRIMSFDTFAIPSAQRKLGTPAERAFHISMAFSDSTIRSYWYSKQRGFQPLAKARYTAACLTQLKIIPSTEKHRLLTASTDGHIVLWEIPHSSASPDIRISVPGDQPSTLPDLIMLSRTKLHQSAILSLDMLPLSQNSLPASSFVLATGGDDNGLCITVFHDWKAVGRLRIRSAHAAAITGVAVRRGGMEGAGWCRVVTVGGYQRVKRWMVRLGGEGQDVAVGMEVRDMEEGDDVCTSVADAAGLVQFGNTGTHAKIMVYGAGLETFTIEERFAQ